MKTVNMNALRTAAFLTIFAFFCVTLKAQDKITLLDGTELVGKVTEITDDVIKYKVGTGDDAMLRSIATADVFMITYANGTKEVFDKRAPAVTATQEPKSKKRKPDEPETHVKFGGPRLGLTYIGPGYIQKWLTDQSKNPLISQFGWQFEKRIFSFENGPHGMFEFVPLIGGMEQGLFLPSASLLIGIRAGGKGAIEVALGPNVSVAGLGMVFAIGTNYQYKNVNFPVNFAYVPSVSKKRSSTLTEHTGHRFSLIVGFNVRKN